MVCFDYFLLMKFRFFQHYYPETESARPAENMASTSKASC